MIPYRRRTEHPSPCAAPHYADRAVRPAPLEHAPRPPSQVRDIVEQRGASPLGELGATVGMGCDRSA